MSASDWTADDDVLCQHVIGGAPEAISALSARVTRCELIHLILASRWDVSDLYY